ncbi:MAG: GIY-YIG nuclease family protein, partial [Finegoldia magna]|nr:GIY-YIG nuclease family protein [Finegoldia magna]
MNDLRIFENKNSGGYVYIINFGSMVKIGSSNNPKERISRITTYLKNYANINSFGFKISVKHVNFRE